MDTSNFDNFDNKEFKHFSNPAIIEKDLQSLYGLIEGIISDDIITKEEQKEVLNWANSNKSKGEKQPYKDVIHLIKKESFEDDVLTLDEARNILWLCNQYLRKTNYFDVITNVIQQLIGIVKSISIDDEINIDELKYLDDWLEENSFLKNTWPYDELYSLITSIMQDGKLTKEEHDELLAYCKTISGNVSTNSNIEIIDTIKSGYCQIDPEIIIHEHTFCITGVSKKFKRREIAEKIELFGGVMVSNVSSKLDYLIVCSERNDYWAFTCHGRKIEEAIRYRKQGGDLQILHEYDVYDAIEDLN